MANQVTIQDFGSVRPKTAGTAGTTTKPITAGGNINDMFGPAATVNAKSPSQVAAQRTTAQRPTSSGSGQLGSNSLGNYSTTGSTSSLYTPTTPTATKTEEEYLSGTEDGTWTAQQAALEAALKRLKEDLILEADMGLANRNRSLSDLGWDSAANNWSDDPLKAYGAARQSNVDDFSARGLLSSSAFSDAQDRLNRSFTDQKSGIDKAFADLAGAGYTSGDPSTLAGTLGARRQTADSDYASNLNLARADALARYKTLYGL